MRTSLMVFFDSYLRKSVFICGGSHAFDDGLALRET
jgi:hypothetical protein